MNLTSENEINRLLSWASENVDKNIFLANENVDGETFWKTREKDDTYIMLYDFKTIPEFEKICNFVSEEKFDKRIQRVISVAAFRNSKNYERDEGQEKKAGNELPEQIYVF